MTRATAPENVKGVTSNANKELNTYCVIYATNRAALIEYCDRLIPDGTLNVHPDNNNYYLAVMIDGAELGCSGGG